MIHDEEFREAARQWEVYKGWEQFCREYKPAKLTEEEKWILELALLMSKAPVDPNLIIGAATC